MRIVQLNLWLGKMLPEIEDFLATEAPHTDVFCFQEVSDNDLGLTRWGDSPYRADLLAQLQRLLPDFALHFVPSTVGEPFPKMEDFPPISEGCAIAVKRSISLLGRGSAPINGDSFDPSDNLTRPREMVWVTIPYQTGVLTIANVHGLVTYAPKTDNPRRLAQSRRVNDTLATVPQPFVLCGDFNINADTQSRALLAAGRQDLIKDFTIPGTRTPLYPSEYGQFADYAFCSRDLRVKSYVRLAQIVSDHYALAIELE